jgi:hypothetical protein
VKPKGYVDLVWKDKIGLDENGLPGKKFSFIIQTPSRNWVFVANEEKEKEEWVRILQPVIDSSTSPPPPPPPSSSSS